MGSSSGSANPMYLSQGVAPIPGLPIAGQGAPNDNPKTFGQYQEFLPTIQAPGGTAGEGSYTIPSNAETRRAPVATGLKSEMFQYRSPFSSAASATPVTNSGANTGGTSGSGGNGTTTTGGTASPSDIDDLRKQLAALQAQVSSRGNSVLASGSPTDGPYPFTGGTTGFG